MTELDTQILVPAAALAVWTMIVLGWMMLSRLGGFKTAKINLGKVPAGWRASDAGSLNGRPEWPAHNYMHLMEQPTVFYPVILLLALGEYSGFDVALAWIYVGLRIAHSIWQNLVNTVPIRATLFVIGSLALGILSVRALLAVIS